MVQRVNKMSECEGCYHYNEGHCGYFDCYDIDKSEEELFTEHCVGCCCGDGYTCNKDNGGCMNYEKEMG